MKKALLIFPLFVLVIVSSCKKDDEPEFDLGTGPLAKKYESILTDNKAWRVSKVESDKPRHFIHTYFNPDISAMESVELIGTDWFAQMQQVNLIDPQFPLERPVMLKFDAKSGLFAAQMDLYAKDMDSDEFEFIQFGQSAAIDDYTTFNMRLSSTHISFYGYHNQDRKLPLEPEVWKNFRAEENLITYQVEKVYNDTTYLVHVELVPTDL